MLSGAGTRATRSFPRSRCIPAIFWAPRRDRICRPV